MSLVRTVRWLGLFLILFAVVWVFPLNTLYHRWDSNRLIKAYAVDPTSVRARYSYPAEYIQPQLKEGMTKEQVHKIIHTYWKMRTIQDLDDQLEVEIYTFDPLQTLYAWISYDKQGFTPHAPFDRTIETSVYISLISFGAGVVFLLLGFFPFRWFTGKGRSLARHIFKK